VVTGHADPFYRAAALAAGAAGFVTKDDPDEV
jgi:DNA-binding NarL/FixJ family response regulator